MQSKAWHIGTISRYETRASSLLFPRMIHNDWWCCVSPSHPHQYPPWWFQRGEWDHPLPPRGVVWVGVEWFPYQWASCLCHMRCGVCGCDSEVLIKLRQQITHATNTWKWRTIPQAAFEMHPVRCSQHHQHGQLNNGQAVLTHMMSRCCTQQLEDNHTIPGSGVWEALLLSICKSWVMCC